MLKSLFSGVTVAVASDCHGRESNNIANVNTIAPNTPRQLRICWLRPTRSRRPQKGSGVKNAVQVGLGTTVS